MWKQAPVTRPPRDDDERGGGVPGLAKLALTGTGRLSPGAGGPRSFLPVGVEAPPVGERDHADARGLHAAARVAQASEWPAPQFGHGRSPASQGKRPAPYEQRTCSQSWRVTSRAAASIRDGTSPPWNRDFDPLADTQKIEMKALDPVELHDLVVAALESTILAVAREATSREPRSDARACGSVP
jgi:hypothetical protein